MSELKVGDRELMELAAVACGMDAVWSEDYECMTLRDDPFDSDWCPDTDDGDSARMRSALLIDADWFGNLVQCAKDTHVEHEYYAEHNDRNAALRLATLKVAAEIGRRMKESSNG